MTTISTKSNPHGSPGQRRPQRRSRLVGGIGAALSPRDVAFVLFRHKRKVVAAFLLVGALATIAALAMPNRYQSAAKLQVKLGRESVTVDPTATIGQTFTPMQNRDLELNSELEILASREVAEAVATTVGPAAITGDAKATLDDAIREVRDSAALAMTPGTASLTIEYVARSPTLARDVTAAYIDSYLTLRQRVYRNSNSQGFFAEQHARAQRELDTVQTELRELKDRTGVADLATQRANLLDRISALESQLDASRATLAGSRATIGELAAALEKAPEQVITSRTTNSPLSSIESLRQRLVDLRLEEQDLASRYVETSPPVVAVREQITKAEKLLNDAKAEAQETTGINRVREELAMQVETERAAVAAGEAKVERLSLDLDRAKSGLALLNSSQIEFDDLTRRLAIAADNVQRYAEKREEVRIDQALEADQITNISVVDGASLPVRPAAPNRKLLLIAGWLMALLSAGATAFAAEALDHTVKRPEDLNKLAGRADPAMLDSTVSIPRLRSGQAVAKPLAAYADDLAASLSAVFDTAGQQSSRAVAGTRGALHATLHLGGVTIRAIGWAIGATLIGIGNAVVNAVMWPVHWFRSERDAERRAQQEHALALDEGPGLALNEGLVSEYEELQDEDLGEEDRPEPKAEPERRTGRSLRLVLWAARREVAAMFRRDKRPNLQLSDRRHRTAAATAVWRSARGLVEQLVAESEVNGLGERVPPTVAVVAARPESGATTVAAHLAAVIAERVVENAEHRNGEIQDKRPVLLLQIIEPGPSGPQPAVIDGEDGEHINRVTRTPVSGLERAEVMTLRTSEIRRALNVARRSWRHVILDLPPVFADLDSHGVVQGVREDAGPRLAALCDASVLVLESGKLRREAAGRALERLDRAGTPASVLVLNKRDYPVPQWIYKRA